ncbi:MAG: hypothetical protein V4567_07430, partial [Pseudomonadota bacterium]
MAETSSDARWQRDNDDEILLTGSWTLLLDARRRRRLARELGGRDAPHRYRWNLDQLDALD